VKLSIRQSIATAAVALLSGLLIFASAGAAQAANYVPVSGAGSSWSSNAIDQWRRNVKQYGMNVDYANTGSSDGRNQFKSGTVDFAVSEIPYGLTDGGVRDEVPNRSFAYMPIVAGGTSFMYNLTAGGKRITNLRLSGTTIAKIFTGAITKWDDAAIKADNPQIDLPSRQIVPVVRSDGSGSTAQFTLWMSKQNASIWDSYCRAAGRSTPCGLTSNYPVISGKGFIAQPNSQGVAGYVSQTANVGTITYVEYSYALKTGFPVAKVLNKSGYYVEPTASNVAVALLGATINSDLTQNLAGVYGNADKRAYPLSSYSYMILPTRTENGFTTDKGKTLGAFSYYFLCEGQNQAEVLGYSPLPINLVKAGLNQVKRIPGVTAKTVDIKTCNNPTFSSDGTNTLATKAAMPQDCDKQGSTQCATGTGGAAGSSTTTTAGATDGTSTGGTGTGGGGGYVLSGINDGAPVVCNNDTGVCTPLAADTVKVDSQPDWGLPQTFMLIAVLLLIAIITVPPLVAVMVRRGKEQR